MASTWGKQAAGILRMWTRSSTVQCLQSQPEVSGHLTVLLPPPPQSPEQDFIMRTAGTFPWDCEGGRSRCRGLEGRRGQSREKQPSQPGACAAPSSAWVAPQQGDHTALPRHSSLSGRPAKGAETGQEGRDLALSPTTSRTGLLLELSNKAGSSLPPLCPPVRTPESALDFTLKLPSTSSR